MGEEKEIILGPHFFYILPNEVNLNRVLFIIFFSSVGEYLRFLFRALNDVELPSI